jgi:hypothetical protein
MIASSCKVVFRRELVCRHRSIQADRNIANISQRLLVYVSHLKASLDQETNLIYRFYPIRPSEHHGVGARSVDLWSALSSRS